MKKQSEMFIPGTILIESADIGEWKYVFKESNNPDKYVYSLHFRSKIETKYRIQQKHYSYPKENFHYDLDYNRIKIIYPNKLIRLLYL